MTIQKKKPLFAENFQKKTCIFWSLGRNLALQFLPPILCYSIFELFLYSFRLLVYYSCSPCICFVLTSGKILVSRYVLSWWKTLRRYWREVTELNFLLTKLQQCKTVHFILRNSPSAFVELFGWKMQSCCEYLWFPLTTLALKYINIIRFLKLEVEVFVEKLDGLQ